MDPLTQAIETVSSELPHIKRRPGEHMKNHTSFKIGGPVKVMYFPENPEDMVSLCRLLRDHGAAPLILGNGTNLLVNDDAMDIAVINTTGMHSIERTGQTGITACAGVSLAKLAVFACECGLSGLEFAHGIPGTLGGAVIMNAGAYGGEIGDAVSITKALSQKGDVITVKGGEHDFSYRHSRFSDFGDVVLSSVISMQDGDKQSIRARMDELSVIRRENQPLDIPSAGSAFKRPKDGYAAQLIEQAGLKGYSVGGAQVSQKHAGFIVNRGGAIFPDVLAVIEHVREVVFNKFGIELEPEVKIISV